MLLKHVEASERINISNNISKAQSALDDYEEGAIVRSQARWTELGEKNMKYFLTLESKHVGKKLKIDLLVRKVLF